MCKNEINDNVSIIFLNSWITEFWFRFVFHMTLLIHPFRVSQISPVNSKLRKITLDHSYVEAKTQLHPLWKDVTTGEKQRLIEIFCSSQDTVIEKVELSKGTGAADSGWENSSERSSSRRRKTFFSFKDHLV